MKIALVGNQNSGKTTLFNTLTGMNAKIGNWPGVTIEKKTGIIKGTNHEIIDLPGIYSLSPYSTEEEVSRKFIFEENPDIIINLIDSTSLERSLYLTTQLLELDCKVIIALNMVDYLEKTGFIINEKKLEQILGIKVLKISALKGTGVNELIQEVDRIGVHPKTLIFDNEIEKAIFEIEGDISKHKRFISVKLLEDDKRFENFNTYKIQNIIKKISKNYDTDLEEIIATQRYDFIEQTKKEVICKKNFVPLTNKNKIDTDKLDKIFLNKWLAFPIFIIIMFFIYYLSVGGIGKFTSNLMSESINKFGKVIEIQLQTFNIPEWLNSLVIDGIISGVGAVLSFIPQLIILFTCILILESTGYMSRVALILDKLFRKIGLSGKSLIPFIVGSGCSVPGIMGTRIIENNDEREITTILTPFIPCSAKLPIIVLFSGCFFENYSGFVAVSTYFLAIAIIIFSAIIMNRFIYKNTNSTYISELPQYRLPNIKYIFRDVFEKTNSFIKRAGSVILISSIVIWFLLSFSFDLEYGINIENSILAWIGKSISWIFYPILGVDSWSATVSSIQGLIAKEQVISSMSVISGFTENSVISTEIFQTEIFGFFTKSSAYAFMIFNLFSAPCFGAISAMRRELGNTKKMFKVITFQIIFAWCLATVVYQIGSRIERGMSNFYGFLFVISIITLIFIVFAFDNSKKKDKKCPHSKACTFQCNMVK